MENKEIVDSLFKKASDKLKAIQQELNNSPSAYEDVSMVISDTFSECEELRIDFSEVLENGNAEVVEFLTNLVSSLELFTERITDDEAYMLYSFSLFLGNYYLDEEHVEVSEKYFLFVEKISKRLIKNDCDYSILAILFATLYRLSQIYEYKGDSELNHYYTDQAIDLAEQNDQIIEDYLSEYKELLFAKYLTLKEQNKKKDADETEKKLISLLKQTKRFSKRDREIYTELSFKSFLYYLSKKYKKIKIACIVVISLSFLLFISNLILGLTVHQNLYTVVKLYLYDGSSVINDFRRDEPDNEEYRKGESIRCVYPQEAIGYFEKALSQLKEQLPEDDVHIAWTRMVLGEAYLEVDRYDDAYEQFSNAYVTYKNAFGLDHDNTNEALMYIAICNLMDGDYESSKADLYNTFDKMKYFGSKQEVCYYLSELLLHKGDYEHALEWGEHAIGYCDVIVGGKDITVYLRKVLLEIMIGDIYYQSRDLDNALRYYSSAFSDLKNAENAGNVKGVDYSSVLNQYYFRAYQRMGNYYGYLENDQEMVSNYDLALDYYYRFRDGDDADGLYITSQISYEKDGKNALKTILENLEKTKALNGDNNEYVIRHLRLLTEYYLKYDNYEKAVQTASQTLETYKDMILNDSGNILGVYLQLSAGYLELEEYDKALEAELTGLELAESLYEYSTKDVVDFVYHFQSYFRRTEQYDKAFILAKVCSDLNIKNSDDKVYKSFYDYQEDFKDKLNDSEIEHCMQIVSEIEEKIDPISIYQIVVTILDLE